MKRVTKMQFKVADCTLMNSLKIVLSGSDLFLNQGLTNFCIQFQKVPRCSETHLYVCRVLAPKQ